MAERRVPDLAYGHIGDASYDINEGKWKFSVDTSRDQIFEQIAPFKENVAATIQNIAETTKKPQRTGRSYMKWVANARPEAFPANIIASMLAKSSITQQDRSPSYGQLIAIGGAVDAHRRSGHRTHRVIAVPCGDAGHALRLVKPRSEYRGWGKQGSVTLPLLDAGSGEFAYWVGTGGTIRQIVFSSDEPGSGTLLAIRQDFMITIFRPTYHKHPVQATTPSGYAMQYPPSRLAATPVATLKAEVCGPGLHADISFNPFYDRQFAVVDDSGRWSIWDSEGWNRKNTSLELVRVKSGRIHDGSMPDSHGDSPDTVDGWHRILWVGNVSTIVVCSRSHIAAFDVKSTPSRLPGLGRLSAKNNDWILDIKRSSSNANQIYILTTHRVFWAEVVSAGEQKGVHEAGIRIILSYRHFRDVGDETLSLTVLQEEDGKYPRIRPRTLLMFKVSVLVSSSKSLLVNFYTFSMRSSHPTSYQGSFSFLTNATSQISSHEILQTICFLPAPLTSNPSRMPGPELELMERDIKFYQVWALTPGLALRWTLFTMYIIPAGTSPSTLHITAPTVRKSFRRIPLSGETIEDPFVVPDDFASEDEGCASTSRDYEHHQQFEKAQAHLQPLVDWRGVFRRLYLDDDPHGQIDLGLVSSFKSMSELVDSAFHRIEQGMESGHLPMVSLFELSQSANFAGDLQESDSILQAFLEMLQTPQSTPEAFDLVVCDLGSCPGVGFTLKESSAFSGLLGEYDQVGELWMASLPLQVSNPARLSKFKVARKVAVELCLSLISISVRNRSSQPVVAPPVDPNLPSSKEQNSSELVASTQTNTNPPPATGFSLPTPSRTPSVYSHTSNDESEVSENPAILRLRQYAVSIKSLPDLGESALLAQWPSALGADPAKYSWQSMVREQGDESDSRRRRDEERRRRRTEKFLNREAMDEPQASSQLTVPRPASQPEPAQHAASSQSVGDMPMTQPGRGVFGARPAKAGQKKKGKRRAAGF